MSSNIKPKTPAKEAPTEPFKRAVAACLRAIAREPQIEVAFAAERPGIAAGKVRLPEPPRRLTRHDARRTLTHVSAAPATNARNTLDGSKWNVTSTSPCGTTRSKKYTMMYPRPRPARAPRTAAAPT